MGGGQFGEFLASQFGEPKNRTKWRIFLRGVKVATAKADKVANILRRE